MDQSEKLFKNGMWVGGWGGVGQLTPLSLYFCTLRELLLLLTILSPDD
jgi:hypothetical protein